MNKICQLMAGLVERGGSDLHLTGDTPPYYRVQGSIVPVSDEIYNESDLSKDLGLLLGKEKLEKSSDKELDCSYSLEKVARFRINVFYDRGRISAVMRALSSNIPTFNQLGLPSSVQQLLNRPRGLMLVTGPTGSGKTTTLASSIDWINENKPHHILTIEDPIEFVYSNKIVLLDKEKLEKTPLILESLTFRFKRRSRYYTCRGNERFRNNQSRYYCCRNGAFGDGNFAYRRLHNHRQNCRCIPNRCTAANKSSITGSLVGVISQTLCKQKRVKESQQKYWSTIMQLLI